MTEVPRLEFVRVTMRGALGRLTLDRPDKRNALSNQVLEEIVAAAAFFDASPDVTVVIVEGNGRSFCAGADVSAFEAPSAGEAPTTAQVRASAELGRAMADSLESMRAVTVARIHGHCVGGGVVLASACDLRVAADDSTFSIPELALGIPLTWGGIPRLVRDIGAARTRDLVMTCRPFDAAEALAIGFVTRIAPAASLDSAVDDVVASLIAKSALTLGATKRHVNAIADGMVAMARAWNDADSLVAALRDGPSRDVARTYLRAIGR
ncbi:MAG TPA: enoyl-CoA hydratase/isomerase family protein [Acidimicrobiales bacterium]|nr:enoyl-CoA hydratase/isomerase family protein [Acidimicrobiales bacterium]